MDSLLNVESYNFRVKYFDSLKKATQHLKDVQEFHRQNENPVYHYPPFDK